MTVSKIFLYNCYKYFYSSKRCTDQSVKSVNAIHVSFPISSGDLIILAANCNLYSISAVYNYLLLSVQSLLLNQPNTAPHTSIQTCQPCQPMFEDVFTNKNLQFNRITNQVLSTTLSCIAYMFGFLPKQPFYLHPPPTFVESSRSCAILWCDPYSGLPMTDRQDMQ